MPQELKELFRKMIAPNKDYPAFRDLQQVIDVLDQQGFQTSNELVDLLRNRETDLELRRNIILILGITKYKQAVPAFVDIAENEKEDISLRRGSLVYLASLAPKNAYNILSELILHNPVDDIRIMAATLLFYIPTKACLNLLLKVMRHDKNEVVRSQAARSIGLTNRSDKTFTIQPLLAVLNNPLEASVVRAYAAEALGFIRDASAIDSLVHFLSDQAPSVRYMCAYALGELGDERYFGLLEPLLLDNAIFEGWGTVAEAAQEAIEKFTRICPI